MVLIITSTLVAIISTAWALSLRSRLRKEEERLAVYSRLLDLDTMPSEVAYLAQHLREKREKEVYEAAERRRQRMSKKLEIKEECIKRQRGNLRTCNTCGGTLNHAGPPGLYHPGYMIASCPSCGWSCNYTDIIS